jgi:hypothetical protein
MRPSAALALALAWSWLTGCTSEEDEPPGETPGEPDGSAPSAALMRAPLAAPAAFDVALTGDGAALVWNEGNRVRVQWLDAQGAARGEPVVLTAAPAREIAAAGDADRLAVAWLEVEGKRASVHAAMATNGRFDAPAPLGPSQTERTDRRGHVVVSLGRRGRLVAFHRGPDAPCEAHARCASYAMHELPPRGSDSLRPSLVVPSPCDGGIVGVALAGAHWNYGVCALEEGRASTTVFTAQDDPPYAQAQAMLPGCSPLGMTALDREVWMVGVCDGRRSGVRWRGIDLPSPVHDLSNLEIVCRGERAALTLDGEIPLAHPVAGLGPLLPSRLAPGGARAVWTGSALLVAYRAADTLELARYRCLGGMLLRG